MTSNSTTIQPTTSISIAHPVVNGNGRIIVKIKTIGNVNTKAELPSIMARINRLFEADCTPIANPIATPIETPAETPIETPIETSIETPIAAPTAAPTAAPIAPPPPPIAPSLKVFSIEDFPKIRKNVQSIFSYSNFNSIFCSEKTEHISSFGMVISDGPFSKQEKFFLHAASNLKIETDTDCENFLKNTLFKLAYTHFEYFVPKVIETNPKLNEFIRNGLSEGVIGVSKYIVAQKEFAFLITECGAMSDKINEEVLLTALATFPLDNLKKLFENIKDKIIMNDTNVDLLTKMMKVIINRSWTSERKTEFLHMLTGNV